MTTGPFFVSGRAFSSCLESLRKAHRKVSAMCSNVMRCVSFGRALCNLSDSEVVQDVRLSQ
jgi:hypothetical protein